MPFSLWERQRVTSVSVRTFWGHFFTIFTIYKVYTLTWLKPYARVHQPNTQRASIRRAPLELSFQHPYTVRWFCLCVRICAQRLLIAYNGCTCPRRCWKPSQRHVWSVEHGHCIHMNKWSENIPDFKATSASLKLPLLTLKLSRVSRPSCIVFGSCFNEQRFKFAEPNLSTGTLVRTNLLCFSQTWQFAHSVWNYELNVHFQNWFLLNKRHQHWPVLIWPKLDKKSWQFAHQVVTDELQN